MLENFRQLLAVVAPYWSQLAILGTVTVAGMKVVTDRLNKRDELRYGELLKLRNAEIRNYALAVGTMFSRLNTLTVVINNDRQKLEQLVEGLIAVHEDISKTYVSVVFFMPEEDGNAFENFNDTIVGVCMDFIQAISQYLNNGIDIKQLHTKLVGMRPKLDAAADTIDASSLLVQKMIRKNVGV